MKRKLISLILCLVLFPAVISTASAQEILPLVVDNADLLTDAEEAALEQKAQALQTAYGMDVVILTVDGLGGKTPQDYADDYFDYTGYGPNGALFLISMEERDWYISTSGDAIYALTDYGIQQLGELAVSYLSGGDYYGGFDAFLTALPDYFSAWESSRPMDGYADVSGDYYHGDREETVSYQQPRHVNFLISLVIGLAVGGVVILIMVFTMNTKRPQNSAAAYLKDGSFHLRANRDIFQYSHVSKVKIQQNNGSSGGGSSVHHSSSGSSHGGGGGKF